MPLGVRVTSSDIAEPRLLSNRPYSISLDELAFALTRLELRRDTPRRFDVNTNTSCLSANRLPVPACSMAMTSFISTNINRNAENYTATVGHAVGCCMTALSPLSGGRAAAPGEGPLMKFASARAHAGACTNPLVTNGYEGPASSVNRTVAPSPTAPSAQTRPPWRSIMRRTIASPIPVPSNSPSV
jgi:hypothetical protein